jgi:Cu/Ag efflux protein CusF
MRGIEMKLLWIPLLATSCLAVSTACAQTAPAASNAPSSAAADRAIGEVASVDAQRQQIVLKEDKGTFVVVTLTDKTALLRVPPGETDIRKATRIVLSDIGAGDRLLAVGPRAETGGEKTAEARTIVVINKSDLAQKQQRDQEEWQRRGISGTVAGIDAPGKSITVSVGDKKFNVQTTGQTEFRRYAPDSAKFSDSRSGALDEVKTGDQIRVLGEKNEEALTVTAERVVSGTFVRVVGTLKEIDAPAGQIRLTELGTGKAFTIRMTGRSTTRQLPPQIAALIARRLAPNTQAGPAQPGAAGRGPGALRASGGDINQILDRLPTVSLADLKPGATIIISGTPGTEPGRVTALALLSGIEPITSTVPNVRDLIGGWNIGGGAGEELPQ